MISLTITTLLRPFVHKTGRNQYESTEIRPFVHKTGRNMHEALAVAAALAVISLSSCQKLDIIGMAFGSSPVSNVRFAQSKAWNDEHGFKSFAVADDDYKVYISADAHIENTHDGLSRFVTDYLEDTDAAPFALFLGDAMEGKNNFGTFLGAIEPVNEAGRSLMCIPGNHDLYFGQWKQYIEAMKTGAYIFEVTTPSEGSDLYVCLDSSDGSLGTAQRAWLGDALANAADRYRNIIICTHTHFFKKDNSQSHTGNFNLEETYDLAKLFSDSGVKTVLTGHDHHYEKTEFKGITFFTLAAIADKEDEAYYYTLDVKYDETILTQVRIR